MSLPAATQQLSATGVIQRRARCPQHDKQSSLWLNGTQPDFEGRIYWVFVCKEKGRHTFNAIPDPTAPKTAGEMAEWTLGEKAKRAGIKVEKQYQ